MADDAVKQAQEAAAAAAAASTPATSPAEASATAALAEPAEPAASDASLGPLTSGEVAVIRAGYAVEGAALEGYDLEEVLTMLGTGEAIVTVMNEKGAPSPVAWTRLRAPQASMSPSPDAAIDGAVAASALQARYGTAIDRESAHELLTAKMNAAAAVAKAAQAEYDRLMKRTSTTSRSSGPGSGSSSRSRSSSGDSVLEQVLGSKAARDVLTGVVEGIFGTRRRK